MLRTMNERTSKRVVARSLLLLPLLGALAACSSDDDEAAPVADAVIEGRVMSGQAGLEDYQVRVFASVVGETPKWQELTAGRSNASGHFVLVRPAGRIH